MPGPTVFAGVVEGVADIIVSVGGVDAGTLVIAGVVVAGLVYAANKLGVISISTVKK